MRIVQIGNFGPSFSTESHLRLSLESLGHDVIRVQENEWTGDHGALDSGPALVLYTHTHGWGPPDAAVDSFLAECRRRKIPTAGVHLDLWRGLERESDVGKRPFFRVDYLFTADGADDSWWRARGINHIWSPPAVLEASCYLADPVPEFSHDVVFAGQANYHSEHPRRELVEWLQATYGARFQRYPIDGQPAVREHRLNQLYASAKVIVGDSCFAGKLPRYWSDRLPETLGRGGRLVWPRIEGLPDDVPCRLFEPGNFGDLSEKIEDALSVGGEAALQERRRAVEWTKAGHTYRHRLERVLAIVTGQIAPVEAPVEAPAMKIVEVTSPDSTAGLPPEVVAAIESGRAANRKTRKAELLRAYLALEAADRHLAYAPELGERVRGCLEQVRVELGEEALALVG